MRPFPFAALNFDLERLTGLQEQAKKALEPVIDYKQAEPWQAALKQMDRDAEKARGFRIGFVGAIKAGKSTLLNALFQGAIKLPAEPTVCTAALTMVQGTKAKRIHAKATPISAEDLDFFDALVADPDGQGWRAFFRQMHPRATKAETEDAHETFLKRMNDLGEDKEITINNLRKVMKRRAAFGHGPWNPSKQDLEQDPLLSLDRWASASGEMGGLISEVTVFWPHPGLPESAVIIDTPGLLDPIPSRSEATRKAMESLDAIVMCVKGNLDSHHLKELRAIKKIGIPCERVIVALTGVDKRYETHSELKEVRDEARRILDADGWSRSPLVNVSAFAALYALLLDPEAPVDLLPPDHRRTQDKAQGVADDCERVLGLAPGQDLQLHERLWRASNIDSLMATLASVAGHYNTHKTSLERALLEKIQGIQKSLKEEIRSISLQGNLLEKVASGKLGADAIELSDEAKILRDNKKSSEDKISQLQADLQDLKAASAALRQQEAGAARTFRNRYAPRWNRQAVTGTLYDEGIVSLATGNDAEQAWMVISKDLPALPPHLGTEWAGKQGKSLAQAASQAIRAHWKWCYRFVSEGNWREIEAEANKIWNQEGDAYLGRLSKSGTEQISQYLAAERRDAEARLADLQRNLTKDAYVLATRTRAEAEVQLAECRARLAGFHQCADLFAAALQAFNGKTS